MTSQHRLSTAAMDEALTRSMLAAFPAPLRDTLIQEALRVDLPAGTTLYYEEDEPRWWALPRSSAGRLQSTSKF